MNRQNVHMANKEASNDHLALSYAKIFLVPILSVSANFVNPLFISVCHAVFSML